MNKQPEIVAIIPARGGSKCIKNKNIVPLCGKPLIAWTVEAALGSKKISRCVVSTDSEDIADAAKQSGAEVPFLRPSELAKDDTPMLPVIQHAAQWLEEKEKITPDYVVILQPTSPLRTAKHIDEAIEALINSPAESLVSIVKVPHNFGPHSLMVKDGDFLKPFMLWDEKDNIRQKKPEFLARNGAAIYICSHECLMKKNSLYGDTTIGYEMSREDSIDIDDGYDLKLCEWLLTQRKK